MGGTCCTHGGKLQGTREFGNLVTGKRLYYCKICLRKIVCKNEN
jgi:hypothetical protein